jgi:hypothetical protein
MADIVVTVNQVGRAQPQKDEVYDFIAAEAIAKGQPVYQLSTGKVGVADANAAGKQQVRGIALTKAAAGSPVAVLKRGFATGFTVSGLNADSPLYLSDTAGSLADAAGTMTVVVARVVAMTDYPTLTKLVYVDCDWSKIWS